MRFQKSRRSLGCGVQPDRSGATGVAVLLGDWNRFEIVSFGDRDHASSSLSFPCSQVFPEGANRSRQPEVLPGPVDRLEIDHARSGARSFTSFSQDERATVQAGPTGFDHPILRHQIDQHGRNRPVIRRSGDVWRNVRIHPGS